MHMGILLFALYQDFVSFDIEYIYDKRLIRYLDLHKVIFFKETYFLHII